MTLTVAYTAGDLLISEHGFAAFTPPDRHFRFTRQTVLCNDCLTFFLLFPYAFILGN